MWMTLGFISFLLAAGPGVHSHEDEEVATMGSIYAVEACRGKCSAEERRTLYRGHVVLLDGTPDLEELRGRDGWTATKFPAGSNGCLTVRRYRDEASGAVLAEPVGFNAPVAWSRTESGGLLLVFTTDGGERLSASLERKGPNWVGQLRSETSAREGDQIVIWQVGNGGTEHCVTLAK
jgi:hypothetical protein